jgi:hypothetical protein
MCISLIVQQVIGSWQHEDVCRGASTGRRQDKGPCSTVPATSSVTTWLALSKLLKAYDTQFLHHSKCAYHMVVIKSK